MHERWQLQQELKLMLVVFWLKAIGPMGEMIRDLFEITEIAPEAPSKPGNCLTPEYKGIPFLHWGYSHNCLIEQALVVTRLSIRPSASPYGEAQIQLRLLYGKGTEVPLTDKQVDGLHNVMDLVWRHGHIHENQDGHLSVNLLAGSQYQHVKNGTQIGWVQALGKDLSIVRTGPKQPKS